MQSRQPQFVQFFFSILFDMDFGFQVAECAICFWYHEHIAILIEENCTVIMPIVFPALYGISKEHRSPAIVELTKEILETFMERHPRLCDELVSSK